MGTLRGLITLALLIAFVALFAWLFLVRKRKDFEAAANIPLRDEPRADDDDKGKGKTP